MQTVSITPSRTPSMTPSVTPSKTPSMTPSRTPSMTPSKTPSVTPECTKPKSSWRTGDSNSQVQCKCTNSTKNERVNRGKPEWWCKQ